MAHELAAFAGDRLIVTITGRWLHPLLVLRDLVAGGQIALPTGALDPVVGKAAAFLYAELGMREVRARIASRGALELARRSGFLLSGETLVDAIACATETELRHTGSIQDARRIIESRIQARGLAPESLCTVRVASD